MLWTTLHVRATVQRAQSETFPELLVGHDVFVVPAPMGVESVPTVALEDVPTHPDRAYSRFAARLPHVTAEAHNTFRLADRSSAGFSLIASDPQRSGEAPCNAPVAMSDGGKRPQSL